MKCLLDLNIVVDLLTNREPFVEAARRFVDQATRSRADLLVSAAAIPTIHYIVRQTAGRAHAFTAIDQILTTMSIATTDAAAIIAARAMPGTDFEDNVQIACAIGGGCDLIVTRDLRDFALSPIKVLAPTEAAEFLAAL